METGNEHVKRIWQGAILLSIAAIITKVLSAAYRIPYQNIAGDIGFYVYQQVYPFYGIALILSIYGFPVVISKILSEHGKDREQQRIVVVISFYVLMFVSLVSFALVYFGAGAVAQFMGDKQLKFPLQVTAFSFLMIPFLSVLRGYHQGNENMKPTAVSQVGEQFARVLLIIVFAYYFISYGPYAAGTGAALGSVLGALIGIMVLFVYFLKSEKLSYFRLHTNWRLIREITSRLFKDSLLICFSALVFVFFQLIDALTLIRILQDGGWTVEGAKITKGIFDRGQPLLQLGTVIATAFSLALVPMISKAKAKRDNDTVKKQSELALRLTFIVSLSAAVGLAIVIGPTNAMLFTDRSDSNVLAVLGFTILFSSIVMTTAAILQGYGHMKAPAFHVVIGLIVKLICNLLFVSHLGTMGAAIGTVAGFFIIAVLNLRYLQRIHTIFTGYKAIYIRVVLSVLIMSVVTYLWKNGMETFVIPMEATRFQETVLALSSVSVGAIVFLFCILRFEIFAPDEMSVIPKGEKLNSLQNILKKER
ncbi:putative polysaccharide biosynthesis protein [Bacillus sp. FJAT-45350]|uniref:putative polysaccharide biosynthesis protein n=1 Tax=Bacillus sp. FJAT-45350 TaxID=2011014 RepID=UPI0015C7CF87|nr:polysaccharide biosynthesis protein [Bacillus sp. FJAT-45350]